jgi:hypothetical protein
LARDEEHQAARVWGRGVYTRRLGSRNGGVVR